MNRHQRYDQSAKGKRRRKRYEATDAARARKRRWWRKNRKK